jgi:hypothetical protein
MNIHKSLLFSMLSLVSIQAFALPDLSQVRDRLVVAFAKRISEIDIAKAAAGVAVIGSGCWFTYKAGAKCYDPMLKLGTCVKKELCNFTCPVCHHWRNDRYGHNLECNGNRHMVCYECLSKRFGAQQLTCPTCFVNISKDKQDMISVRFWPKQNDQQKIDTQNIPQGVENSDEGIKDLIKFQEDTSKRRLEELIQQFSVKGFKDPEKMAQELMSEVQRWEESERKKLDENCDKPKMGGNAVGDTTRSDVICNLSQNEFLDALHSSDIPKNPIKTFSIAGFSAALGVKLTHYGWMIGKEAVGFGRPGVSPETQIGPGFIASTGYGIAAGVGFGLVTHLLPKSYDNKLLPVNASVAKRVWSNTWIRRPVVCAALSALAATVIIASKSGLSGLASASSGASLLKYSGIGAACGFLLESVCAWFRR